MKTILIVGCYGQIGTALIDDFQDKYRIIGCDVVEKKSNTIDYYQCDASHYSQLETIFSENTIDAVINLAGLREMPYIPSLEEYDQMVNCYLNSTFLLLMLMQKYGVKKMILASSNHVTDYYENNGYSTLNRMIRTDDYPISKGVYGTLKLAAENLCRVFNINYNIKSVVFRIATYRNNNENESYDDRWNRTRLSREDMVRYFEKAIEVNCDFCVYYLVSENKDKPWDTTNLKNL